MTGNTKYRSRGTAKVSTGINCELSRSEWTAMKGDSKGPTEFVFRIFCVLAKDVLYTGVIKYDYSSIIVIVEILIPYSIPKEVNIILSER